MFQEFNLLDTFSLEDNIYLPLVLAGQPYQEMAKRLVPIAKQLGIQNILKKYPYEVSGGQKQRAAAARALITNPGWCWRMSPPALWTPGPRMNCCPCLGRLTGAARPS